jgi:hypothetical protein
MAWPVIAKVALSIPWADLIRHGPDIVDAAGKLLRRSKNEPLHESTDYSLDSQLQEILRTLDYFKTQDRHTAEIIKQLAVQSGTIVQGMQALERRVQLSSYCALLAIGAAATSLVLVVLK